MPEMVDEKQVQQPAPASPASKGEGFRRFAQVWVVLIGVLWGVTLAVLLSQMKWLGGRSVPVGSLLLSPGGLVAGLAVGAALIWILFKKFGDKLAYSKPGLGRWVRLSAYGGLGAMTLFGAYAFYMSPSIGSIWWQDMFRALPVFGKTISLKPILFPSAAIAATVLFVIFQLLNRDKWAEFLIETEGEIKKVSWPARKEYLGSSMVVVLVVAIVSIFLHFVDMGLSELMNKIGIGF